MGGRSLTNPFDRDEDPIVPKIKKPEVPAIVGKRIRAWVRGFGEKSRVTTVPTKRHPFEGVVLRVKVSGVNHLHVDVRSDDGRWYGFCDQIGFEYEVVDG